VMSVHVVTHAMVVSAVSGIMYVRAQNLVIHMSLSASRDVT